VINILILKGDLVEVWDPDIRNQL